MHKPEPFAWNYCPICGDRLALRGDGERVRPHCARCRRFYYRNPLPAVCCVVTRNESELLLGRRAIEPCRGEWALPGGFIELGETTEQALIREMREETALDVDDLHLIGVTTQQSVYYGAVTVAGYLAGKWSGTLQPDSDVSELQFFPRDRRPDLPFTAHREILALFDQLRRS